MGWLDPVLWLLALACIAVAVLLFAACFWPEIATAAAKLRGWLRRRPW